MAAAVGAGAAVGAAIEGAAAPDMAAAAVASSSENNSRSPSAVPHANSSGACPLVDMASAARSAIAER